MTVEIQTNKSARICTAIFHSQLSIFNFLYPVLPCDRIEA